MKRKQEIGEMEIERRFETIYANLDDILQYLFEIEAEEGESTGTENCRAAVDILATQIEVLRRKTFSEL